MSLKYNEYALEGYMILVEKYYLLMASLTAILIVILKQFDILIHLYRYVFGIWSLVFGMFFMYLYIKHQESLSKFLTHLNTKKVTGEVKKNNVKMRSLKERVFCPYYHPDIEITISKDIDHTIQKFLEMIISHYILSWYRKISNDTFLLSEISHSFKLSISLVIYRIKLLKASDTMLKDKILKAIISHLDMYQIHRNETLANVKGSEFEQLIMEKSSSLLHITIQSRKCEIEYLRHLSSELLPLLLPENMLKSSMLNSLLQEILACRILLPCMDMISDPDFFNYLLLVLCEGNVILYPQQMPENKVVLLKEFVSKYPMVQEMVPRLTLKEIVHNQDLLFLFMNFMKSEGVLNIIQFYMSLEDFMKLILNPDLKLPQIDILYRQCQQIYSNFFDQSSPDRIDFDSDTIEQMKQVTEDSPNNVLKLRNTSPLYSAREHVVSLLDNIFIPLFCKSSSFSNWELGGKSMFASGKNNTKASKKGSDVLVAVSKLGNRIKGAFKNSAEGQIMAEECSSMDNDDSIEDEIGSMGSDLPEVSVPTVNKDLSLFSITIPKIESRIDPGGKQNFVFIIYVQKSTHQLTVQPAPSDAMLSSEPVDIDHPFNPSPAHESLWYVERRYPEFYVLESKLAEFHGTFEDIQLPAKRAFSAKDWAFINAKKPLFENYLQKLCNKPELRNSELLYTFLTSQEEFTSSFLPDINIGKMFKAPLRLLPEKGQHLDPFLRSFINSTDNSKTKNKNSASSPQLMTIQSERTFVKHLYNNPMYERSLATMPNVDNVSDATLNLPQATINTKKTAPNKKKRKQYAISGFYDYIIYFCFNIYHVPEWIIKVLLAFRLGIKPLFEWYLNNKLNQKVMKLEHPAFIVDLLNLLKNLIFPDEKEAKTLQGKDRKEVTDNETPPNISKEKKAALALEMLQKQLNSLKWLLPEKNIREGTLLIFDCFQHPILNKHLTYVLMDTLIGELFPELSAHPEKSK